MLSRSQPIKMTPFSIEVLKLIQSIPKGRVASYGQIATLAGKPGGARGVGWILHACAESHQLPWQRVINSQGRISFPKRRAEFKEQRKLLLAEGVEVSSSGAVDLDIFGWKKKPKAIKRAGGPKMFR